MGSGGQQPVTQQTTQTKDPWSVAQPHLADIMTNAANYYAQNVGYQPFTGNTTAPWLNAYSTPGVQDIQNLALGEPSGSANLANARDWVNSLISSGGMTGGLSQAASGLGSAAGGIGEPISAFRDATNQVRDVYNRAQGDQNPYLQSIIDTNNRRIGDRINASMSGAGRYGSGQHTDVMARALAESADPILAQDYANRQQLQLQATGQLGQMLGQMGGLYGQQGQLYGQMGNLYGQAQQQAGQAAQLTPTLDQARYASGGALMGLGDANRSYEQALLDQGLKLWNAQQAYPWEQLSRYSAISGQAGGLGGTQITTSPGATQPSTLQRLLGGSLAGAGIGSAIAPGIGTGIGAIGGGLLGLL